MDVLDFPLHTDHLGTPRVITDPSTGQVVWRWGGEPFGASAPNEDPDGSGANFVFNLRFPGQYYDAQTGLDYNYFRDYDPRTGRYVESDPSGLWGGLNRYGYVNNDPISISDLLALQPSQSCVNACTITGGVFGGAMGFAGGGTLGGVGGTLVEPGGGTLVGGAVGAEEGGAAGAAAGSIVGHAAGEALCPDKECSPCRTVSGKIVPEGTIGYTYHRVPPAKPHWPLSGSHYHLFVARQNPNNCQCHWQPLKPKSQRVVETPPAGSIKAEPFQAP